MHFKRFLNGRLTLVIFLPSAQKFGFKPWRVSSHQTKNIVSMYIWQFSKLRWANSIYVLTVKFATGFGFGATTNWRDFRWLDCLSLWLISSLSCLELLYNSFCTELRRLIFQGFVLKRFFFYQLLHRHILVSTKNIYSIFRYEPLPLLYRCYHCISLFFLFKTQYGFSEEKNSPQYVLAYFG